MPREQYKMNSWKLSKIRNISVSEISKVVVNDELDGYLEQFLQQNF